MQRLINFWEKYCAVLSPDASRYIRSHGQLEHYRKGEIIKLPDEPLPYLCIVLDGLVAGFELGKKDTASMRELILPMDYFSGTAHPFTTRNRKIEYAAISNCTLLKLPLVQAKHGQQAHPDLAELFQVMKQRKINLLRKQVAIYQETDLYCRYCLYAELLRDWTYLLPHHLQMRFLQMSKTTYARIKKTYLEKNN